MRCPKCSHEFEPDLTDAEVESLSAKQIEALIEADENSSWWELHDGDAVRIDGLGPVKHVAKHGGNEGSGEEMWFVIRIGSRLFKKSGYHASWDGSNWDGPFEEVRERERMQTVYE